ncbi:hypothetical protein R3W88_010499 [Solanum pinnatisectum]|uniref:RING-type domain-containing protein n=1 Tax=Solanum pinnatisectum TaxID=50273 RepID=A0AAV9MEB0_9SOLN|nr:hypothetical protein R3W88_010499 [Solanum pinnatisectum]
MDSTNLQILNSVEVDPTLLNFDVIAITENNNDYESENDDIKLQKVLFYSAHIIELGETLCALCEICENAFPLPNTMMWGTSCNHHCFEECIQNYIGKKINEDIQETYKVDVNRPTKVLASPLIMNCPFMDCMGKLIDDQQGYPIRACPECWRLLCQL